MSGILTRESSNGEIFLKVVEKDRVSRKKNTSGYSLVFFFSFMVILYPIPSNHLLSFNCPFTIQHSTFTLLIGIAIVFLSSSIFNFMLESLAIIKDGMQKIGDRERNTIIFLQ